jgi:hypothetical protein
MPGIGQQVASTSVAPERRIARGATLGANKASSEKKTIWVDLDNSPHVPFFRPIINELKGRGYSVLSTARNCFQVGGLAEQMNVSCKAIGRHYGKNRFMKLLGLGIRTLQLVPLAIRNRPQLAVSHGSRSQLVAAKLLGIPTLQIVDYEFAKIWMFVRPDWVMTPSMIPSESIGLESDRVLKYPGIKEDVYVPSFIPNDAIRSELGMSSDEILVTIRPPASEAHYHNPKSDSLFQATVDHLAAIGAARMVVLPRTERQAEEIRKSWPELCSKRKLILPGKVLDGLNLIWNSDLVISGGGTMNREAAALGIPVYSIFRGKIGAVDTFLAKNGRMILIESPEDLRSKLQVSRRRPVSYNAAEQATLEAVVQHIAFLADSSLQKQTV